MNDHFLELAAKYKIPIKEIISTNELGLDFLVAVGKATDGKEWILRIPRRDDILLQIQKEQKSLQFLKSKVSFEVPDWQVANSELIAYPLLTDKTALQVNLATYEQTWHIDLNSDKYSESLASRIFELHSISKKEIEALGVKSQTPEEVRQEISNEILLVKSELGISTALETQWKSWVDEDSLWAPFSTLIHGDLYAGHTLVNQKNEITGIIDWSEMQVGDPSVDFAGHYTGLGELHLDKTLECYKKLGGKTWERMKDQIIQRSSAAPLKFAVFALKTKNDAHVQSATEMLK